jgi:hypothetical protein
MKVNSRPPEVTTNSRSSGFEARVWNVATYENAPLIAHMKNQNDRNHGWRRAVCRTATLQWKTTGFPLKVLSWLVIVALLTALCLFEVSSSSADEVVINESSDSGLSIGDFSCSPVRERVDSAFELFQSQTGLANQNGEVTVDVGELYAFFKSQGITSLDRLVLYVDVSPTQKNADFGLQNMQLSIEDSSQSQVITSFSFRDNNLMVPSYETSARKPEARLEIQLPFDFMTKFSESSTEKLKLNLLVDEKVGSMPFSLTLRGSQSTSFSFSRFFLLLAFAVFWVVVFWVLFRFTVPRTSTNQGNPVSA